MVIKRQKLFFAPLAFLGSNAFGTALTGGMLVQGGMQMKQSSDQAAEAEEQNRQQVKAMNRIAKAAESNPIVAQQFLQQKQASEVSRSFSTIGNATGFVKDLGKFAYGKKRQILNGVVMGGTLAAGTAVVDKVIQKDIKRNNLPLMDNQPRQEQFSAGAKTTESLLAKGGDFIKRGFKAAGEEFKGQFKGVGGKLMTGGFILAPGIGYLAERSQYKDQIKSTKSPSPQPQQKQYAKIPGGSIFNGVKKFIQNPSQQTKTGYEYVKNQLKNKPVERGLEKLSKALGQSGKDLGNSFEKLGQESKNPWTQGTAKFLKNHGKTAAVAGIGVGGVVMSTGWGAGEKYTKKAIKSVDPNAYAYQDSKEQQIN